jgi:hypothetical protein
MSTSRAGRILISRARHAARAARTLTAAEWLLLVEATVVALAVRVGLGVFRLPALASGLDALPRRASGIPIDRAVQLANRAAVRIAGPTCLCRALVLFGVLRRRGEPAELVIGVRRQARRFDAHAWLIVRDRVFVRAADQQTYTPLWRAGSRAARCAQGQ